MKPVYRWNRAATLVGAMPSFSDADVMLLLALTPGLGSVRIARLLESLGTAPAVLAASARDLAEAAQMPFATAQQVRRDLDALADGSELQQQRQLMAEHQASLITLADAAYPRSLKLTPDPPAVLFVRGRLAEDDALALAIVGSRRCTLYGREQADRFAAMAAQAGLCIVSGGAFGIDAAAHRAALRVKGRTVAVLGNGLADPYPQEHHELFEQIVAGGGALVSELPMHASPRPEHFPRRNRIISGLSLGVLVIEAAARSGALITARLAAEDHGREVMALPGRVDSPASAGCHKMIREGWATLVSSPAEVLDTLGEAGAALKASLPTAPQSQPPAGLFDHALTPSQRSIVEALDAPLSLDQLVARTALPVATIQADLTLLQLRGLIERRDGKLARRRA